MLPGPDPTLDKSQVTTVFREADDPFLTTAEISAELPTCKRAVQNYLQRLEEDGKLMRKKAGGNIAIWWLNEEEPFWGTPASQMPDHLFSEPGSIYHSWPLQLSLSECSTLSSLDIPGDQSQLPERRCAILAAYLLLRQREKVPKREFISRLFRDHQAGYSNANSWWERLVRANLNQFPPVSKPHRGGLWTFNADNNFMTKQSYTTEKIYVDISSHSACNPFREAIISIWRDSYAWPNKNLKTYSVNSSGEKRPRVKDRSPVLRIIAQMRKLLTKT